MRGKLARNTLAEVALRITPACAGKTTVCAFLRWGRQDHPRVCGENLNLIASKLRGAGSPPRVRGKPQQLFEIFEQLRITPACAGKTLIGWSTDPAKWDHPRVCGENTLSAKLPSSSTGSPPRVRGKLLYRIKRKLYDRITPACAGKTRVEIMEPKVS